MGRAGMLAVMTCSNCHISYTDDERIEQLMAAEALERAIAEERVRMMKRSSEEHNKYGEKRLVQEIQLSPDLMGWWKNQTPSISMRRFIKQNRNEIIAFIEAGAV